MVCAWIGRNRGPDPTCGSEPGAASQQFVHVGVDLGDDGLRHLGLSAKPVPPRDVVPRHPLFLKGRHVRQLRRALLARHPERLEASALDLRQRGRQLLKHRVDLIAHDVLHGRRASLVRDVRQLRARHEFEKLAGQVRGRPRSRGPAAPHRTTHAQLRPVPPPPLARGPSRAAVGSTRTLEVNHQDTKGTDAPRPAVAQPRRIGLPAPLLDW